MKKVAKVFLGGTCNGSKWREELIPQLTIEYFNPQLPVGAWNEKAAAEELKQREECDYCLYVITPKITGFYSIAEVIDDSHKRPEKTLFAFGAEEDDQLFDAAQIKSLKAVAAMVEVNGGKTFSCLTDIAEFLNNTRK